MQLTAGTKVLFLVDSEATANNLHIYMTRKWPDCHFHEIIVEHSHHIKLGRHDLPLSQVPMIHEVDISAQLEWSVWPEQDEPAKVSDMIEWADIVAVCCDFESNRPMRMEDFFSLHAPELQGKPLPFLVILDQQMENEGDMLFFDEENWGQTRDDRWQYMQSYHEALRYFDFNWHLNAIPVISSAIRTVLSAEDMENYSSLIKSPVSRGLISMLMVLKQQDIADFGDIYITPQRWPGSGKYNTVQMAGIFSIFNAIENLKKWGCLQENREEKAPKWSLYRLTDKGRALIATIHPKVLDPDMPARTRIWAEDWPASKPKMDRWIRQAFGSQKRMLGRLS